MTRPTPRSQPPCSAFVRDTLPMRLGACLSLLAAALFFTTGAVRAAYDEYQVKAVWIYNLAQFGRWPATAFADAKAPFTIGVAGDDSIVPSLEAVTKEQNIRGRKLLIKRGRTAGALKGCQIVFVSKSEASRLGSLLAGLAGQGILTVGETAGFCAQGGMVNLAIVGGSVDVELFLDAITREGLKIAPQLIVKCRTYRP